MPALSEEKWLERMKNECRKLSKAGFEGEVSPDYERFVITIKADGFEPSSPGNAPRRRTMHEVQIDVSRRYPFEAPKAKWLTPIFHPNIIPPPPRGNGQICMEMLSPGGARNLAELVRGLTILVENPNPSSPLHHSTCLEAKRFFERRFDTIQQTEGPRIIGLDSETNTGRGPRIVSEYGDESRIVR